MHWEVQYPEPKEPKPRPFDFYDVITCLGFAYAYTIANFINEYFSCSHL